MDFEFGFSARSGRPRNPEQPLRILVLADLSGSSDRVGLTERKPLRIEVDNLETRLGALFPSARLSEEIVASFESLDDFHPDHLYQHLEIFRSLRELRARLANSATFAAAAAELRKVTPLAPSPPEAGATPAPADRAANAPPERTDDFARLLGAAPTAPHSTTSAPRRSVDELLHRIIAPHIEAAPDPGQPLLIAAADQAIGDTMRAVLRHPAVAGLETAWLGLSRLVRNIEAEEVQVFALDVSRAELTEQLASGDPRQSALHRILIAPQEVPGTPSWSLWAADFAFGASPQELRVLGALGALSAQAGAGLLADASPSLLGIKSFSESPDPSQWPGASGELADSWLQLRRSEVASWIGLCAPRILLRLPYGAQTDPTERFSFEEMPAPTPPAYAWGRSALAVAQLAASAFAQEGPDFAAPDGHDIEDLPVHVYQEGGETVARATAEAYLPERASHSLLAAGIIPILSIRGRDAARLVRVQSIAESSTALRGPWS